MKIFSSPLRQSTCATRSTKNIYGCALSNMGIPLTATNRPRFTGRLNLTEREIEVCAMHFVDGRPQSLIAEWLGLTIQCVRQCVANAVLKQPQLRSLRTGTPRSRIVHMSQLNCRDRKRGPFNVDEL